MHQHRPRRPHQHLIRPAQPQLGHPDLPAEASHPYRGLRPEPEVPGPASHVQDPADQPQERPGPQGPHYAVSGRQRRVHPPALARSPLRHGLQEEPHGDHQETHAAHEQSRRFALPRRAARQDRRHLQPEQLPVRD